MGRLSGEHDHSFEEDSTRWGIGDLGVEKGMRATNTTIFIVREVKDSTLLVSDSNEFPGEDAGDGYLKETRELIKMT